MLLTLHYDYYDNFMFLRLKLTDLIEHMISLKKVLLLNKRSSDQEKDFQTQGELFSISLAYHGEKFHYNLMSSYTSQIFE